MRVLWKFVETSVVGLGYGFGGALGLWAAEKVLHVNIVLWVGP